MIKLPVYNLKGQEKERATLDTAIFGVEPKNSLIHQVIVSMLSNRRHPIAHTKNKGEVSGGGRKPWRQKGTGRARAGSTRSPLWIGGGITFGPRKEKNFKKSIPQAMKRQAMFMALSARAKEKRLILVDKINIDNPKTKEVLAFLEKLPIEEGKILFILAEKNLSLARAAKNFPFAKTILFSQLNPWEILTHNYAVMEKETLAKISEHFLPKVLKEKTFNEIPTRDRVKRARK